MLASSAVELRKETASPLPPVEGDPEMLKQLLLNLVINAIQAMPDGGEVVVSAALREGKMLISVQDQGRGIAPESRDKIFDPFFTTKDGWHRSRTSRGAPDCGATRGNPEGGSEPRSGNDVFRLCSHYVKRCPYESKQDPGGR